MPPITVTIIPERCPRHGCLRQPTCEACEARAHVEVITRPPRKLPRLVTLPHGTLSAYGKQGCREAKAEEYARWKAAQQGDAEGAPTTR